VYRLLHGDVVPGAALVQEAHRAAVHQIGRIERRHAPHLAPESMFGEIVGEGDARPGLAQRSLHLLSIVADRGNDAEARHNNSSHWRSLVCWGWRPRWE